MGITRKKHYNSYTLVLISKEHDVLCSAALKPPPIRAAKNMEKACPVVLRSRKGKLEILVFKHPLAGVQIVKGTIEPDGSSLSASERELEEEAGIKFKVDYPLLEWQRHPNEPIWSIWIMEPGDHLPDHWNHYCEDDGGHLFQYFWHPLSKLPDSDWHPVFADALAAIRESLTMRLTHAQR